jgi:hypothetical protein
VQAQTERVGLSDLRRALHAASQPNETMQTMIFEPATLRLHLAIGSCPSSAAEMRTLELAPLFWRSEPRRGGGSVPEE